MKSEGCESIPNSCREDKLFKSWLKEPKNRWGRSQTFSSDQQSWLLLVTHNYHVLLFQIPPISWMHHLLFPIESRIRMFPNSWMHHLLFPIKSRIRMFLKRMFLKRIFLKRMFRIWKECFLLKYAIFIYTTVINMPVTLICCLTRRTNGSIN